MGGVGGVSRLWRRVLVGWAVAVAVGGGLTLWLQDSEAPHGPYTWQRDTSGETPAPVLSQDAERGCPSPTASPYDDPRAIVLCLRGG